MQEYTSDLDEARLIAALAGFARTPMARARLIAGAKLHGVEAIRRKLTEVDEVLAWQQAYGFLPVDGVEDIAPLLERASRGGVLDGGELMRVARSLVALDGLGARLAERAGQFPALAAYQPDLVVHAELRNTLARAFDETGELNARMWPELGDLREQLSSLQRRVQQTLSKLLRDDQLSGSLQDRFVTQRNERYVIPVKANADRHAVGIVHDVSGTGQTYFVEPHEVVALNNEIRVTQATLLHTERRIFQMLSAEVGHDAAGVLRALSAAVCVDEACARAAFSKHIGGYRPTVRDEGVLRLIAARHPLLVLQGGRVVGNDLLLDDTQRVLVVSGPNAGGKTVALKTVGLCAVLVQLGCFVPAAEGSRVDVFPRIDALVGDHQGIAEQASSYAAQLSRVSSMLDGAGPGQLVLIDEIGNGTDPEQGAVLAAAVLERLRDAGARVLVTTHLARLKTWSLAAHGVASAGMAFEDGQPTFRLQMGHQGQSHAFDIALRRGIPPEVVNRAGVLLADGQQDLALALEALDQERADAALLRREVAAEREVLAAHRAEVQGHQAKLAREMQLAAQRQSEAFTQRLEAAERAISAVVAGLQRAPSHEGVARARATLKALSALGPSDEPSTPEPAASGLWRVGDLVHVQKPQALGRVVSVGRQVGVQTDQGLVLMVAPSLLRAREAEAAAKPSRAKPDKSVVSKQAALDQAVRYEANTLDLRGQRVDEALDAVDAFFASRLMSGESTVFLLHGHGTGALKKALREVLSGLPAVARWRPAASDQGGDAYTVVALKG